MGYQDQVVAVKPFRPMGVVPQTISAASSTDAAEFFTEVLQGPSVAATHLRAQIRRVGPYFRTASLAGESGCGEEQVARALHEMSRLREKRFLALSAAEAEERFGAGADVRGLMREGLVFLTEAARMSAGAQRGLLRALRERTTESARVVAFVGKGLRPMISAGMYSVELAGALGALRVSLPALRERTHDIPLLLEQMLRREVAALTMGAGFLEAACAAPWPGNLVQLRDVVRWLGGHREGVLCAEDLAAALAALKTSEGRSNGNARLVRLEQVVQEHVLGVLVACNGNKLKASEVLGISRSTLYRMLEDGAPGNVLAMAG